MRPPVKGVTTAGGETVWTTDGAYRTWVVVSCTTAENDPACLAEVDPFTGRMLSSYRMATAGGAWGVAVSRTARTSTR